MAVNWNAVREKSRTAKAAVTEPAPIIEAESKINTANGVMQVPIDKLTEISEQPFRIYTEDEMISLVSSIQTNGVLSPISIRPQADGYYQIIDGRNRVEASKQAGRDTIPALIKDVDDDTAWLMLVDSKLYSGIRLLPMEKAFAYKIKMDTMRHQGRKMPELENATSAQSVHKSVSQHSRNLRGVETADKIGSYNNESGDTVRRYISLTKLIEPFHPLVNSEEIKFVPAVNISSLTEEEQEILLNYIQVKKVKVSVAASKKLKELHQTNGITFEALEEIFSKKKKLKQVKIPFKKVKNYLPEDITQAEAEEIMLKALKFYIENKTEEEEI